MCCGASHTPSFSHRLLKRPATNSLAPTAMKIQLLLSLVAAQTNLDDATQVSAVAKKIAARAITFYTTSPGGDGQGAVQPSSASDASGIQWYESGIYWEAVLAYSRAFNDNSYGNVSAAALALASGSSGSFLGSNSFIAATLLGKWNDDIMWWGLAAVSGAELYGTNAVMPSGKTYLQVAIQTYNEAWEQWDTTQCGGGIYWSRDRSSSNKGYKSTITNVQHIMLGSRLYTITKNSTYLTNAKLVYAWMKQVGLVSSTFTVYDGVNGDNGCGAGGTPNSYTGGMTLGSLGYYFTVSGDTTLLTDSSSILKSLISLFTKSNVFTDPCEPNCKPNEVQPKGTMIRGIGAYGAITTNAQDKATIQSLLKTSTTAMLATCDSSTNCGTYWSAGTVASGANFHSQTNALELINAYQMSLVGLSSTTFSAPVGTTSTTTQTKNGAGTVGGLVGLLSVFVALAL